MTFEPTEREPLAGWNSPPPKYWDEREQEMADLRRHWRSLGLWRSWRAGIACYVGQHLIGLGMWLMVPHVSRQTAEAFDRTCTHLLIDADVANEGLLEARELIEKEMWKRNQ